MWDQDIERAKITLSLLWGSLASGGGLQSFTYFGFLILSLISISIYLSIYLWWVLKTISPFLNLSLPPSTSTHATQTNKPCYTSSGTKLRSSCLHSKHFTNQDAFPASRFLFLYGQQVFWIRAYFNDPFQPDHLYPDPIYE